MRTGSRGGGRSLRERQEPAQESALEVSSVACGELECGVESSRGPLGEGELDDDVVTCPWHAWQFNVKTGVSVNNPSACVKTYQVKVEGSDIKVLL